MARSLSARRSLAALFVAGAAAALFVVSRGKWSDAIIDSGREWIVPDALSRGALLYRDVDYWFGPFTPYAHAAFFRLFGSSFATLVVAGCAAALAALAALWIALVRVADRSAAILWTALAVPALVFMPNAGGAILGMGFRIWHAATFALLAIAVAAGDDRRVLRWAGAGALAALAGLCRTEWGLAALSAAALVVARRETGRGLARSLAAVAGGFLLVFCGVWSFFFARAGWDVLLRGEPVFLLRIPEATRSHVGLAGLRAWRTGSWNLLYSASVWLGVVLGIELLVLRRVEPARSRRLLYALAAALLVALGCAAMGAVPGPVLFSAAPLICLAALVEGWRGGRGPDSAALAGFGWMGLIASHRRFFFIDDAPYVAPPLLFAFVCAAGLLLRAVRREPLPAARRRLSIAFGAALCVLVAFAFLGRFAGYASDERVAIRGTGGMLSARPELARQIEEVAGEVRRSTPTGAGLVVFPEGEVLNFLSQRPNRLRHKLYIPGYVTRENEDEIVGELERDPPGAIVLWPRPAGEYGEAPSAADPNSRLGRWIRAGYHAEPLPSDGRRRNGALLFLRNGA